MIRAGAFALFNLGAQVDACELSLGIEPWRFSSPDEYVASLDRSARNKLRQGLSAGFAFGPAGGPGEWVACFHLLAETRRRRGVQLKISLDYVMRLREIFGSRIAMRRLLLGDALAAAALLYRVTPDVEYVVAWGDDCAQRSRRVMNVLAYYLVETAITHGTRVIDLGISSVDGVPDEGLINFKQGVGAVTGLRLNFRLPLGA